MLKVVYNAFVTKRRTTDFDGSGLKQECATFSDSFLFIDSHLILHFYQIDKWYQPGRSDKLFIRWRFFAHNIYRIEVAGYLSYISIIE